MDHGSINAWRAYWKNQFKTANESLGFDIDTNDVNHDGDYVMNGPGGAVYGLKNNIENWPLIRGEWGRASVGWEKNFTIDTPCGVRSCTKTVTHAVALHTQYLKNIGDPDVDYEGEWIPEESRNQSVISNILDEPIGSFDVISNNLQEEVNKYFEGAESVRVIDDPQHPWGGTGKALPVHDNVTIRQIAAHQSRINPVGQYTHPDGHKVSITSATGVDPREGLKNLMETVGDINDLVKQTGAIQGGFNPAIYLEKTDPSDPAKFTPLVAWYNDWAAWLSGAVIEDVRNKDLYTLSQEQFAALGLTNSYPSYDGNLVADAVNNVYLQGHHSVPEEIKGLAVAYAVYNGPDGDKLYHEPETSTEIGYAIGSAVFSAKDLVNWAYKLAWTDDYIPDASLRAELFTQQTGVPNDDFSQYAHWVAANSNWGVPYSPFADWPRVNWGFGTYKLASITPKVGPDLEVWGTIGNGGFGGYSGSVLWIESGANKYVFGAVGNTGIQVNQIYAMARDYFESLPYVP